LGIGRSVGEAVAGGARRPDSGPVEVAGEQDRTHEGGRVQEALPAVDFERAPEQLPPSSVFFGSNGER
jgi:hypothetical protein